SGRRSTSRPSTARAPSSIRACGAARRREAMTPSVRSSLSGVGRQTAASLKRTGESVYQIVRSRMSRHSTNPWVVLVVVCLAQFMVVLDATIVNVALPHIQSSLGFSEASLQWVINAYTLVFAGFLLLGGRAGDLLGRKRLFLIGLVVFTVASFLNGISS